ncbi:MAG TPA: sulfotransferase [Bryobacteraceae bacterium]|nr:sulfotransferase [Bryobacteraceae bacterium]
MNQPPIFIVGAPRSGTSLLRQMLNRHPALAICYETHFLRLVYGTRQRRAFGDLSDPQNRRRLVNQYVSLPYTRDLGVDCQRLADKLMQEGASYPAIFGCVLDFYAESQGKRRCGEKTPGHSLYVETLCEWFPGAIVLHIIRDPRDVVASLMRMPFGSPSAMVNARTWRRYALAARRSSHRPEYLEVRYETLVREPEQELTRICRFLGEEFSPCMLTAERETLGHHGYRSPVTTERLGVWRGKLSRREVAQVEWMAGSELEAFGYAREVPAASAATILAGAGFAALTVAKRAAPKLPALWQRLFAPGEIAQYEDRIREKTGADSSAPRIQPR